MMKKLLVVLAFFVAFVFGKIGTEYGFKEYDLYKLKVVAEKINATLPKKIDEYTTYMKITIDDAAFTYDYVLDGIEIKPNERAKFKAMHFNSSLFAVCLTPSLKKGLNRGTDFIYKYSVNPTQYTFVNTVTVKDCEPFYEESASVLGDYYVELQNKTVPFAFDENVSVVKYRRVNMAIEIDYQLLNDTIDEIDMPIIIAMSDGVVRDTCNQADFKVLSQRGLGFNYNFYDARSTFLHTVKVTKEMC